MAYALKFGSYTFPGTFAPISDARDANVSTWQLPRLDGGGASVRKLRPKSITLAGGVTNFNGGSSPRTQLDTMLTSLQGTASLYFDDDRYYRNCQLRDHSVEYDPTSYTRYSRMNLVFVTGDPFSYSTTLTSSGTNAMSTSPKSLSITTTGNASSLPKFTFSTSGATSVAMTFTNSTTGEVFTLNGAIASGATIIVDSLEKTVTISGVDYLSLFEGVFPSLASGANTISIAWTAGGFTNVAYEYRNRWY